MRSFSLPLWILLFGRAYSGIALALPAPTRHAIAGRAETDFFTMYGMGYDLAPHEESPPPDGQPKLAPINEVFMAMTHSLAMAAMTSDPTAAPTPFPSELFTMTSPPYGGPGPALVPASSTVPGALPSRIIDDALLSSSHTLAPSHKMVVLGSVIGSILFFALCIFVLFNPVFFGFCCGPRARKRLTLRPRNHTEEKEKDDHATPPPPSSPSWVTVGFHKQGSTSAVLDAESTNHTIIEVPADGSATKSKFSVCSSEYLSLSSSSQVNRDSNLTDDSGTSTVKPAAPAPGPSPSPTRTPVRPPRPPTADSPALSESVYLACSDQPYVIVVPQPLTETDLQSASPRAPRKKLLTPSEFFTLHVPSALAALSIGLPFSSGGASKPTTSVYGSKDAPARRPLSQVAEPAGEHDGEQSPRVSQTHSRTKSAPMLGRAAKGRGSTAGAGNVPESGSGVDQDQEEEADVFNPIARRVLQHRRSRSTSGWAYPTRAQSRRSFINDTKGV